MDYVQEHLSESKRKSRNLSEKKRRDAFNNLVTELAVLVTGVERRLDKSNVLKQTISFLKRHSQLQAECVSSEEIDQTRPSFLTADEYFRLLLDSLSAFLFVVEFGNDGESAVICYVSENAAQFRSGSFVERLRGKSLYDYLDQENESLVREAVRNKATESIAVHGTGKAEVASSTDFLHFTCGFEIGTPAPESGTGRAKLDFSITARFKMLDGSSRVCVCLAKSVHPVPVSVGEVVFGQYGSSVTMNMEFSMRLDVEWRFIQVDPTVVYILGYEPMELLGTSCYGFCHPKDLDKLAESHESLKTKTDGVTVPYRFRTKSDKYVWIRSRYYITYHEWNSKPEFIVCTSSVLNGPSESNEDTADTKPLGKSLSTPNPRTWRTATSDSEKASPVINGTDQNPQQNRQIFRPQPGVSIEHTPISRAAPISKAPPSKKPKSALQDETPQSLDQMNERMLWELLEKRQTNLQEKILQRQQELKRLQEQLFNAVPLLSSSSPASSNGTNELDINSPASSGLSPAGGPSIAVCQTRSNPPTWPQQQSADQLYVNQLWAPKFFDDGGQNSFSMR